MKINKDKVKALLTRTQEKVATKRRAINIQPDAERIKRENAYMARIQRVNPRVRRAVARRSYVR